MATNFDLIVDGVTMPTAMEEGISWAYNPIWSDDTERSANLKMLGTLLGYKWSLKIKWPPLTPTEVETIFSHFSTSEDDFKSVTFTAPTGNRISTKMYFGALEGQILRYAPDFTVSGVGVSLIEQ